MVEIRNSEESENNGNHTFLDEAQVNQHVVEKFCDSPLREAKVRNRRKLLTRRQFVTVDYAGNTDSRAVFL